MFRLGCLNYLWCNIANLYDGANNYKMLALHADMADFCFTAPASSSYILIFSSNVVVENNRSAKHNS